MFVQEKVFIQLLQIFLSCSKLNIDLTPIMIRKSNFLIKTPLMYGQL